MEEITIYKFQLKEIIEAFRMTDMIHKTSKKETCYDRTVSRAKKYAENALEGKKSDLVKYN